MLCVAYFNGGMFKTDVMKVCTGASVEMIYTAGGETGFVGTMVRESLTFQKRCK